MSQKNTCFGVILIHLFHKFLRTSIFENICERLIQKSEFQNSENYSMKPNGFCREAAKKAVSRKYAKTIVKYL